ncbi:VOC family protein [Muricoccus radiodurans]|uniref:VOC family protein n=1 Tax=Muricoccus radiodurans TaxID=2231721 RepID=UPI003CEFAB6E
MAALDHIVVGAATLSAGAEAVERWLGVRPTGGGTHVGAGTHNLLLGLGPEAYLEVIAPDPDQPEPPLPRLFGLDRPEVRTAIAVRPSLIGWVARADSLEGLAARLGPERLGSPRPMSRGGLSWRFVTPPPELSFDGLLPPLIVWDGEAAAGRLPDSGCRLLALEAEHPLASELSAALDERGLGAVLRPVQGSRARLVARLGLPNGGEAVLASG